MRLIEHIDDFSELHKTTIALGMFDGLHIAHMKIINRAIEYSRKNGYLSGVILFDEIPKNVVKHEKVKKLITIDEKISMLSDIDFLFKQKFDTEFMNKTSEEFVELLANKLNVAAVFVGFNFRFGKGGRGNTRLLRELCKNYGIDVFEIPEMKKNGYSVSSTRIRSLIEAGDVKSANSLLGRNYSLTGMVESGFQNGRHFGVRTANIGIDKDIMLPHVGVYGAYCIIDNKKYDSIINVGANPTFNAKDITVECHIFDFEGDLYGKMVTAELLFFVRDEMKFKSVEKLYERINEDVLTVKNKLRS